VSYALHLEIRAEFRRLSGPDFWSLAELYFLGWKERTAQTLDERKLGYGIANAVRRRRYESDSEYHARCRAYALKSYWRDPARARARRAADYHRARQVGICGRCRVNTTTGGHSVCASCRPVNNAQVKATKAAQRRAAGAKVRGPYACGVCGSREHNRRVCPERAS
jgi:hypothetical protein